MLSNGSSQKIIEVGDGEKLSVQCDYCAKAIIFYGSRRAVMCGHCGKSTVSDILHTFSLSFFAQDSCTLNCVYMHRLITLITVWVI